LVAHDDIKVAASELAIEISVRRRRDDDVPAERFVHAAAD